MFTLNHEKERRTGEHFQNKTWAPDTNDNVVTSNRVGLVLLEKSPVCKKPVVDVEAENVLEAWSSSRANLEKNTSETFSSLQDTLKLSDVEEEICVSAERQSEELFWKDCLRLVHL